MQPDSRVSPTSIVNDVIANRHCIDDPFLNLNRFGLLSEITLKQSLSTKSNMDCQLLRQKLVKKSQ